MEAPTGCFVRRQNDDNFPMQAMKGLSVTLKNGRAGVKEGLGGRDEGIMKERQDEIMSIEVRWRGQRTKERPNPRSCW